MQQNNQGYVCPLMMFGYGNIKMLYKQSVFNMAEKCAAETFIKIYGEN